MALLEILLVALIVLVATLYATWALMPATARQRVAQGLLGGPGRRWFPRWARRRLEAAASGPRPGDNPCNACSASPRDEQDPR